MSITNTIKEKSIDLAATKSTTEKKTDETQVIPDLKPVPHILYTEKKLPTDANVIEWLWRYKVPKSAILVQQNN